MTVKDEILEELRSGTPWVEIREKHRSFSQLYEALHEFLDKVGEVVERRRSELREVEDAIVESEEIAERNAKLTAESEKLAHDIAGKRQEISEAEDVLLRLEAKGFSVDSLEKIVRMDAESDGELLSQMETVKDFAILKRDLAKMRRGAVRIRKEVAGLNQERKKAEEELVSETNRLDDLRVETRFYEKAAVIVKSFFEEGYKPEDFRSLLQTLKAFGIKNDPKGSVGRLLKGVQEAKNLHTLQHNVLEKKSELDALTGEISRAKSALKALSTVASTIKEAENAGKKAIEATAKHANERIRENASGFEQQMEAAIGRLESSVEKLNLRKGEIRQEILYGEALLSILESQEYLEQLPLDIVIRLFKRLLLWSEMHIPQLSAAPSQDVVLQEPKLSSWLPYRLTALIRLVLEGLKKHRLSSKQNGTG